MILQVPHRLHSPLQQPQSWFPQQAQLGFSGQQLLTSGSQAESAAATQSSGPHTAIGWPPFRPPYLSLLAWRDQQCSALP
jgi:hypothetical protein